MNNSFAHLLGVPNTGACASSGGRGPIPGTGKASWLMAAVVSSPPASLSAVEYPVQLLHSPPPPSLKRPSGSSHLQMQVLPQICCPHRAWGSCWDTHHFCLLSPRNQESSQPLNLTAKPKGPELPSASSSPSLKMGSCQSLTPNHGATRDLQSSPSNLPLGKSTKVHSAMILGIVSMAGGERARIFA